MDEPGWAQVLAMIYNEEEGMELPLESAGFDDGDSLVQKTDLEPGEVESVIDFLETMELASTSEIPVEKEEYERDAYGAPLYSEYSHRLLKIKTKGFDVAHRREQGMRQEMASSALAYLTGVLAMTALVQATVALTQTEGVLDTMIISAMLLAAGFLFAFVFYVFGKSGVLNLDELRARKDRFES